MAGEMASRLEDQILYHSYMLGGLCCSSAPSILLLIYLLMACFEGSLSFCPVAHFQQYQQSINLCQPPRIQKGDLHMSWKSIHLVSSASVSEARTSHQTCFMLPHKFQVASQVPSLDFRVSRVVNAWCEHMKASRKGSGITLELLCALKRQMFEEK